MSDYLQVQDVIDHLPPSQEDGLYWDDDLSAINNDWIQSDIDCAESDIDAYIGRYYVLPATVVDNPISFGILQCITLDITIYSGYKRSACGMPEEIIFAFQEAMKKLKDFRDEKAYMPDLPLNDDTGLGRTDLYSEDPIMNQTRMSSMW
jgi:phage gp36-like protein